MVPKMFGAPLWRGHIKKRVAKKWLRYFRNNWMLNPRNQKDFANLTIGDFVNDCTGKNGRVTEIKPVYRRIGKGKGSVLLDIDLMTTNTGCSLCSCGIEPKLSREEVERRTVEFAREYWLGESGKTWVGGEDTAAYKMISAHAQKLIDAVESGIHITNEDGETLPEWKYPSVK